MIKIRKILNECLKNVENSNNEVLIVRSDAEIKIYTSDKSYVFTITEFYTIFSDCYDWNYIAEECSINNPYLPWYKIIEYLINKPHETKKKLKMVPFI